MVIQALGQLGLLGLGLKMIIQVPTHPICKPKMRAVSNFKANTLSIRHLTKNHSIIYHLHRKQINIQPNGARIKVIQAQVMAGTAVAAGKLLAVKVVRLLVPIIGNFGISHMLIKHIFLLILSQKHRERTMLIVHKGN